MGGQTGAIQNAQFSGKCVDLKDGSVAQGATIQLYDCYVGSANQEWILVNSALRLPKNSSTIENQAQCGACANGESNKCYTKFGFTDAECSCANNDGAPPAHCGTEWYDWNCVKNGQNAFIDSGCTKCVGNNGGPCPSTVELEGECGACANAESNKCYTKFGFTDAECSCANNDGAPPAHCGTEWYDWNCVKNGQNAFIDSGCTKCVGNNGGPCPSDELVV